MGGPMANDRCYMCKIYTVTRVGLLFHHTLTVLMLCLHCTFLCWGFMLCPSDDVYFCFIFYPVLCMRPILYEDNLWLAFKILELIADESAKTDKFRHFYFTVFQCGLICDSFHVPVSCNNISH
jgi:hypothetical protein